MESQSGWKEAWKSFAAEIDGRVITQPHNARIRAQLGPYPISFFSQHSRAIKGDSTSGNTLVFILDFFYSLLTGSNAYSGFNVSAPEMATTTVALPFISLTEFQFKAVVGKRDVLNPPPSKSGQTAGYAELDQRVSFNTNNQLVLQQLREDIAVRNSLLSLEDYSIWIERKSLITSINMSSVPAGVNILALKTAHLLGSPSELSQTFNLFARLMESMVALRLASGSDPHFRCELVHDVISRIGD